MAGQRPAPITRTDELLCCLIDAVDGLRADLRSGQGGAPAEPDAAGKVELREPERPAAKTAAPGSTKRTRSRSR